MTPPAGTAAPAAEPANDDAEAVFSEELNDLVADALNDEDDGDVAAGEGDGEEELEIDEDAAESGAAADAGEGEGAEPRNDDGTFAPKPGEGEAAAAAPKPDAAAKPDAATAAATATAKPAEEAKPVWEPLAVTVDGKPVAIEEARISRANGHVYIAMPEAQFNSRFQSRIQRGIVGERMTRDLAAGLRELEAIKAAPPKKSDAEIQAALESEFFKPYIEQLVADGVIDKRDIDLLDAKIQLAKRDEEKRYSTEEAARIAKANEPQWEEQQVNGISSLTVEIIRATPELHGLTREDALDVYNNEFLPVRDALFFRKDGQPVANTEFMLNRLKAKAASKARSTAPASDQPASPATPAPAASSQTSAAKPADAAERFNAGVDASAQPRTTSVKAARGARPPQQRTPRPAPKREPRMSSADEQEQAEDDFRKAERAFLASNDFDFPMPGEASE